MKTRPFTLLIADDHPHMRKFIRGMCSGADDECVEVATGADAVAAFERVHPDCVVMDIEMPGMDGLTATRVIRTAHPDARIIIATSHDTPLFRARATAAGASDFVSKDDLSELARIVHATEDGEFQ